MDMTKSLLRIIIFTGLAWPTTAVAQLSGTIGVGAGVNICIDDGADECTNIDPSGALQISPELRFGSFLGLSLDFMYGWLSVDEFPGVPNNVDLSLTTLAVMPTLRAYLPFDGGDVFAGIGAGYTRFGVSASGDGADVSVTTTAFTSVKVSAGGAAFVTDNLQIGLALDYYLTSAGEICVEVNSDEECSDGLDDADLVDLLQASFFVRLHFGGGGGETNSPNDDKSSSSDW